MDADKLLSCATLFSYASRGTEHEDLFLQLRDICVKQLNREDEKTVAFCEASLAFMAENESPATVRDDEGHAAHAPRLKESNRMRDHVGNYYRYASDPPVDCKTGESVSDRTDCSDGELESRRKK